MSFASRARQPNAASHHGDVTNKGLDRMAPMVSEPPRRFSNINVDCSFVEDVIYLSGANATFVSLTLVAQPLAGTADRGCLAPQGV